MPGRPFEITRRNASLMLGATAASLGLRAGPAAAAERINLWHGWTGADNTTALNTVIDAYNKSGGTATVAPTAYDWDVLFSKWVVAAAGGAGPEVVLIHITEIPEFAERGLLRPMDEVVSSAGIDLSQVPDKGRQGVTWKGKVYAAPLDIHNIGLIYNVDFVKQAGLDPDKPPKTSDEFIDWGKKLTVKDSSGKITRHGLELPIAWAYARWTWYSLIYQFGGTFLNADGTSAVDSEAAHKALQYLVDLTQVHQITDPTVGGFKGEDAFASGQVAMKITGPWEVNQRLGQNMNFKTAPIPQIGDKQAVWANSHCMAITTNAKGSSLEARGKFIRWFYDNFAAPATSVGIIPQNKTVRDSAAFTGTKQFPYYQAYIEEVPSIVYEPLIPNYLSVFSFDKPTPLVTNLQAALTGSKSVADALKDMKAGLDTDLARKG